MNNDDSTNTPNVNDVSQDHDDENITNANSDFPVIGIGASAGGLEALELFFSHVPPDSGMAFLVIQHLDPDHESMLVDLLQRITATPIHEVTDGLTIEPNTIYIIPPNHTMELLNGKLHLMQFPSPRGIRMPIDDLFRSLAQELSHRAIGIILSGTGTDGTLGLRTIHGSGGMMMVQEPTSAAHSGMPSSAISTNLVDYVLPPEAMPSHLLQYTQHYKRSQTIRLPAKETSELEKIFIILRRQTNHDFSRYKQNTIVRRVNRRMAAHRIEQMADYTRYLQQNPSEADNLFRDLLIGVTSFFRDEEAFAILEQQAIRQLFENRPPNQPIRVWVPGCSTGEEAYSIAMLLREQMSLAQMDMEVQIFATDIDEQAIQTARLGTYPDSIAASVTVNRLQNYFIKGTDTYQVNQQIREMVIFAEQSVIKDPPFSKMDLISCRNLLIYLDSHLQKRVIPLFLYALKPKGFLFLGTSETLGEFDRFFTPIDRKAKLFQRIPGPTPMQNLLDFTPPRFSAQNQMDTTPQTIQPWNMRDLVDKVLLNEHTPPSLLVNAQYEILLFHGKLGAYLEPVSGEANLDVLRMVTEGLRIPVHNTLRKAIGQGEKVILEHVRFGPDDSPRLIDLVVNPVGQDLFLVLFEERNPLWAEDLSDDNITDERDRRLVEAERELQATREYLQTTVEELETANEELKSTNEEMQSSNEELQSANEELETSKEELQSVNEELVTVNLELQDKIDDLKNIDNDLNNLLANVEVGIIFVDLDLCVKRFNPLAAQLINLIETDVNRPIGHIVSNLQYDTLVSDARTVLDTLTVHEREVQSEDERWYWLRISPYRTVDNMVDGLVMTFVDITDQKIAAHQVRVANLAQAMVDTIHDPLVVLDAALRVLSANAAFYSSFDIATDNVVGLLIYDVWTIQQSTEQLQELLEQILPKQTTITDFEMDYMAGDVERQQLLINARQIDEPYIHEPLIFLAMKTIPSEPNNA